MSLASRMAACLLALVVTVASAGESALRGLWDRLESGPLQIHGFASLTGVKTSDNRFFGDSPRWSTDFAEIAVNASFQLNPRVLFAGQVLARRAGDMYDGSPYLDYGLVDLTLTATPTGRMGARLGRIKNPLGLYNETRDVPFTRPSIFLPQVIYFDKVRNMLLSTDGAMVFADLYLPAGDLSLVIGAGQPVVDENLEWTLLGDDVPGRLRATGVQWIGSLWYSGLQERLRLGVSGLVVSADYHPAPVLWDLDAGTVRINYVILSAQYNTEHWTLTSEYARLPLAWRNFGPYFPYQNTDGEGYYLQGTYRIRPNVELVLRYEEGFTDRRDRDGSRSSALLGGAVPPWDYYSHIWTLGVRWDVNPYLMVRADYQRYQGTYSLSTRENDPADLVPDWDLFALQIAVRF